MSLVRKRTLVWFGLLLAVWLGSSALVADQLTRRARSTYAEPAPELASGTLDSFRLTTTDGQELGAWFIPGRPERPVVLLVHGNGGDRTSCLPQADLVATEGYPVLLVTVRAHGDSTGERNDFGRSARHDVAAAVDWLATTYPDRTVVIWGRSLGSAAALFASADLGPRVRGYILECPYLDLPTAVRNRTRMLLPPLLEAVAYAGLRVTAPLVLSDPSEISPFEAAKGVWPDTPVLVLAGGADRLALPDEARAIADRIGPRAELVVVDGADHLTLDQVDPDRYRTLLFNFLGRLSDKQQ